MRLTDFELGKRSPVECMGPRPISYSEVAALYREKMGGGEPASKAIGVEITSFNRWCIGVRKANPVKVEVMHNELLAMGAMRECDPVLPDHEMEAL